MSPHRDHIWPTRAPARAAAELGLVATPIADYLPAVVAWHLGQRPTPSHAGYAARTREVTLAATLKTPAR